MRIWDLPPSELCRQHLLGEHRELHALWSILERLERGESGGPYANHPETKRWYGKRDALAMRHDDLVEEMGRRGYQHKSLLWHGTLVAVQTDALLSLDEQRHLLLEAKRCAGCRAIAGLKP